MLLTFRTVVFALAAFSIQCTEAFSFVPRSNPFTTNSARLIRSSQRCTRNSFQERSSMLMYEPGFDASNDQTQQKLKSGFWNALSHTEQWISKTLAASTKENPHARNEVSYVCELNQKTLAVVAGIFRRYREARQLGQRFGNNQKQALLEDPHHKVKPFKRTQVMIIPFCKYFLEFKSFEVVIQAINQARTNGLDFVTDLKVEKIEKKNAGVPCEKDWSINVNGASLHPEYATSPELLDELEKQGQIDEKQRRKIELKNQARQSPYPTLILEVQAAPEKEEMPESTLAKIGSVEELSETVRKLEAIYVMSTALHKNSGGDDLFYDSVGRIVGIEELLPVNPIGNTQGWVIANDPLYNANYSSWTTSNLKNVDSAFEFVFTNLSMHTFTTPVADSKKKGEFKSGARSYLILPKFVSSSATSFEKFSDDVRGIINSIEGLNERVTISVMHPEHTDVDKQSPSPVFVIQWLEELE